MLSEFYYKNRIYHGNYELGGRTTLQNGIYTEEVLYQEGTGSFFLRIKHGTAEHPLRRILGTENKNWWVFIKKLSEEEAKEWVKKNLLPEAYKDIFGKMDE